MKKFLKNYLKNMTDNCIVLMCNRPYLEKAKYTISQLRNIGKYNDDIVLLIGEDLKDEIIHIDNVIIKYFPEFDRTSIIEILRKKPISDGRELSKVFQWQKIHIFDVYFKQWKRCMYIDAGMNIFNNIQKMLDLDCTNKLLAHSDAYPTYEWRLKVQFDSIQFPELYEELYRTYDLEIDYFQSGILYYDTNIIEDNTKDELIKLSKKYIISKTNEQGIMNIYFNCIKKIWQQIKIKDEEIHYYDYWERYNLRYSDYIMLKYPKTR
jgi:hypothetical protein